MEEVPPWSTLEPLKTSEVDFRPLHKPAGIPGAVPFVLLYQPRALIREENEQ